MPKTTGVTAPAKTVEEIKAQGQASLLEFAQELTGDKALEDNKTAHSQSPEEAKPEDEAPPEPDDPVEEPEPASEEEEPESQPDSDTEPHPDAEIEQLREQLKRREEAFQKRIDKSTAKHKSKIEELEAKLNEMEEATSHTPFGNEGGSYRSADPLANVTTAKALAKEVKKAQSAITQADQMIDLLEDNPEYVEEVLKNGNVKVTNAHGVEDYSPSSMRRELRNIQREAQKVLWAAPERQQYLSVVEASYTKTIELVPELADEDSVEAEKFKQVVVEFPELKKNPNWPMAAASMIFGLTNLESRVGSAKPKREASRAQSPRLPSKPKAAPAARAPSQRSGVSEDTRKRAYTGDKDARAEIIEQLLKES